MSKQGMHKGLSAKKGPTGSVTLPEAKRKLLLVAVEKEGEAAFLARTGINRNTLGRLLSGLAIRKGSLAMAEMALQRIEH